MINFWTKQDLKIAELIVANLDELHRRVTELEAEPTPTADLKSLAIALERIATVLEARVPLPLPFPFPFVQYPPQTYPPLNPQINTATYAPRGMI